MRPDLSRLSTALPYEQSFEAVLAPEYERLDADELRGTLTLRPELLSASGVAGLGLFASLAEGACSAGTAMSVVPNGFAAMGLSNETTVTAAVDRGEISFVGTCQYRGTDLWVWNLECRTETGEVCAVSTVRVAVRPRRT